MVKQPGPLITRVFDDQPEGLTRDDVLDNITLYWLTNTEVCSQDGHVAASEQLQAFLKEVRAGV